MKLQVIQGDLTKIKADLLVLPQFEGQSSIGSWIESVDKALKGALSANMRQEKFKAKEGEIFAFLSHGYIPARKVVVVGFGKKENFSLETVRKVTGAAVRYAQKIGAKTVASPLNPYLEPQGLTWGLGAKESGQAMAEGALLASYKFEKYKTKTPDTEQLTSDIEEFTIIDHDAKKIQQAKEGVTLGEIFAHATDYTRDLVNEPPIELTPTKLAEHAKELAVQAPDYAIAVETFDKSQLAKMGAGGILGIARGSVEEPFLIHLIYKPITKLEIGNWKLRRVALVGKGVTFDAGGLSLKTDHHMYDMKLDMAGAATVLGVFSVLSRLKPQLEIHGIIPAVENLPSGTSVKPGDVVKSLSGKTIEIVNTDAEGRVILADGLEYAKRQKPDAIIDLATLTGACMVALGERVAGLMGNSEELTRQLRQAADSAGEHVWPLPLMEGYEEEIKSPVADVTNTHATRYGGAILGGLFLKEFVDPQTPWAHLDIAGPVYNAKPWAPYHPKGATGFGVRTLLNYIRQISN